MCGEPHVKLSLETRFSRKHLGNWAAAIEADGLHGWLTKKPIDDRRLARARLGVAQMLQGNLAEEHFEITAKEVLKAGFRIDDDRKKRSDTDYILVHQRPSNIPLMLSSVSASLAGLSFRHRSMRGNRTAMPDRWRDDFAMASNPSSKT